MHFILKHVSIRNFILKHFIIIIIILRHCIWSIVFQQKAFHRTISHQQTFHQKTIHLKTQSSVSEQWAVPLVTRPTQPMTSHWLAILVRLCWAAYLLGSGAFSPKSPFTEISKLGRFFDEMVKNLGYLLRKIRWNFTEFDERFTEWLAISSKVAAPTANKTPHNSE